MQSLFCPRHFVPAGRILLMQNARNFSFSYWYICILVISVESSELRVKDLVVVGSVLVMVYL